MNLFKLIKSFKNLIILYMEKNFKSILFKLDFLGIAPQLKILNNKIY